MEEWVQKLFASTMWGVRPREEAAHVPMDLDQPEAQKEEAVRAESPSAKKPKKVRW